MSEPETPAKALTLGNELHEAGDLDGAAAMYQRARLLAREQGVPTIEHAALSNLGAQLVMARRSHEARGILEEALALGRQHEPPDHQARRVMRNLIWACEVDDDEEAAERVAAQLRASYGETKESARDRALDLGNQAVRAHIAGDHAQAEALYEETIDLSRACSARGNLATTLSNLANLRTGNGRFEGARAMYEEALRLHKLDNNRVGIAGTTGLLANVSFVEGEFDDAGALMKEAAQLYEALGDERGAAFMSINRGWVLLEQRDPKGARASIKRGLKSSRALGAPEIEGDALDALGFVAREAGEFLDAVALHRQAREKLRAGRRHERVPVTHLHEGVALALAGELDAADAALERSATEADDLDNPTIAGEAIAWRALLAWRRGSPSEQARLMQEAETRELRAGNAELTQILLAVHEVLAAKPSALANLSGRAIGRFAGQ